MADRELEAYVLRMPSSTGKPRTAMETRFWDSTNNRSTLEDQGKSLIDVAAVSPTFRKHLIDFADWSGTMDLRPHAAMSKSEADVLAVIARWQLEDPVGYENDVPEMWEEIRAASVKTAKSVSFFKHPGHADQKSHGRRSASRVQSYKKELAQRAFGEGGGTWDWREEKFVDDGKIVALDAYEGRYKPPTGGWTEDAVADSIVDWSQSPDVQRGLRSRTDANVGMWLDDDSGDLFLDVSIKLTGATPAQANRLAKRENQLAWWDGDNQQLWVGDGAGNYNPS